MRVSCAAFAAILAASSAANADTVELEWSFADGHVDRETRPLGEQGGVAVFALPRNEIVARGASSLAVTPDFAVARKGDDGFWFFSD